MKIKTLAQYWTLEDEEFKVTVVSPVDLLQAAYATQFLEVLGRYDLRDIKKARVETMVSHPEQFPDLAFGPLYYFEAVVGVMPKAGYEQFRADIASWCKVHDSKVFVSEDGNVPKVAETDVTDDPHLNVRMGQCPEDEVHNIQSDVGVARAKKLIDFLKKERDDRNNARNSRDQIFVTNHYALAEATGKGHKKGFYRCRVRDGELIVEKQVKAWPEHIALIIENDEINDLLEASKPPVGLFSHLDDLARQSDNQALVECACEQAAQMGVEQGQAQHAPQFQVVQAEKENEYNVEWPSEFIMLDALNKLLNKFGGTVQNMNLNKSDYNGQATTSLSFSVIVNDTPEEGVEPATATQEPDAGYTFTKVANINT